MTCCSGMSFYQVCLEAVASHLKAGTWNSCPVNPFLNLPSKIINDVMKAGRYDFVKVSDFFLLLATGSLTRLEICRIHIELEHDLFREVVDRNGLKSLRYFAWYIRETETIPLLRAALRSCSNLEEFQSWSIIDFDMFQNCKELKVIKFYSSLRNNYDLDFSSLSFSSLSSLRNLQVFDSFEWYGDVEALVLEHCPHLISVGINDSLNTLEEIHAHADAVQKCGTDSTTIPAHFQLKKCLWGKNDDLLHKLPSSKYNSYKSSFSEKVRTAVSLCPFVEKLIIYVSHKDSLDSLKNLKHLTHLTISFFECQVHYEADLYSLLQVIGEKLNHLTLNDRNRIQVDMIYDLCPHLESLELGRVAYLIDPHKPLKPLCKVKLKRLFIMDANADALRLLLSSCKALEELCIENADCLDDDLLNEVLKLNPLEKLKICDFYGSHLSEKGIQAFVESAVSLEIFCFTGLNIDYPNLKLIRELNFTDVEHRRTMRESFTVFD